MPDDGLIERLEAEAVECMRMSKDCRGANEFSYAWHCGAAFAYRDAIYHIKLRYPEIAARELERKEQS